MAYPTAMPQTTASGRPHEALPSKRIAPMTNTPPRVSSIAALVPRCSAAARSFTRAEAPARTKNAPTIDASIPTNATRNGNSSRSPSSPSPESPTEVAP